MSTRENIRLIARTPLDQWFRRCRVNKKFMHDGQTKTDHNSSPWAQVSLKHDLLITAKETLKTSENHYQNSI